MNRSTILALLIILAVVLCGGWKSVRNAFGREAVRTIYHQITKP
jgi:hypothetical protein